PFFKNKIPVLQQTGNTVRHRREKNRDAARKSRKKQTERADELHERLEQSNSAFQKEIATLKKDLHRYTTALERHEPYCCLRTSTPSSSSSTPHLESFSVGGIITSLQPLSNFVRRNICLCLVL
uniref:Basic leucine zipper ATF-like transcription factor 2 n=1 Tax=Mastacembelus armatus TaxID=205130 RepID=A0A7N8Y1Q1_9TELE